MTTATALKLPVRPRRSVRFCYDRLMRSWFRLTLLVILLAPSIRTSALPSENPASDYALAEKALQSLLNTPLGGTLPRLTWKVVILNTWETNAYSNGQGTISLTRGLAFILGNHPGVWAAAIAHEMGHVVTHSPEAGTTFEAEVRRAYLAAGGNPEDPDAAWAFQVLPAAGGFLNLKGERRTESEADRLGLFLMAEAGFHPDFAVALDRLMLSALGDQTKYSVFLLSHPLWSSRERETLRVKGIALAIFNQRWPDSAKSPGGEAPPIGKIKSVSVARDPKNDSLDMRVAFDLRNCRRRQVRVAAVLLDRHGKLHSSVPAYRAADGTFALNSMLPALASDSAQTILRVPARAVAASGRRLMAEIFLVADDWTIDLWLQPLLFP
jgi:Peptidase family M48